MTSVLTATTPQPAIGTAKRHFIRISVLWWAQIAFQLATSILLLKTRGMSLAEVGTLAAIHSGTVALLELPTGGLADVVGRRKVLLAAAVIVTACAGWMVFATEFWQFAAIFAGKGLGRALASGPAEAWFVDVVHSHSAYETSPHALATRNAAVRSGIAIASSAGSVALAIGALAGGILAFAAPHSAATPSPLAWPMIVSTVIGSTLFVYIWLAIPHTHPARRHPLADIPATIKAGIGLAARDAILARTLLATSAVGMAVNSVEQLTPGRLASLAGTTQRGALLYALVIALGFAAFAVGAAFAPTLTTDIGDRGIAATATATCGSGIALLGLAFSTLLHGTAGICATAIGYLTMFVALGVVSPLRSTLLHSRVGKHGRATIVSLDSLALQVAGAAGALAIGIVASLGTGWSWALSGAVLLTSSTLFLVSREPDPPTLPAPHSQ